MTDSHRCETEPLRGEIHALNNRLKRIHYRPDMLTSFLAQTALTLDPAPP